eukprot:COSAG06_NODE_841_length_11989_cov_4.537763_16_plen_456_part_00
MLALLLLLLLLPLQLLSGSFAHPSRVGGGQRHTALRDGGHLRYFTWYDVGSGPLMHYTAAHTNLRLSSTAEQASAAKADFQQDSLLSVGSALWYYPKHARGFRLRPDVASSWAAVEQVAAELLANSSIVGFNLGDELVWNCLPPDELHHAVDLIRKSFPRGQAIIWYNEATPVLSDGISQCNRTAAQPMQPYTIPSGLDWFSIDMYHTDGPQQGWVTSHVRKFYQEQIYPNLTAGQRALLVPGAFGSNVNRYPNGSWVCNNTCYDEMCALDAAEYYSWAKEDPRVVAIAPWNYNGCPSCNGSKWTPPHTCCMNELGAKVQPRTLAAYERIGLEIKQQQQHHGGGGAAPAVCNLSAGAWSNGKTENFGHIEFDQDKDGAVFVHSAHWGNDVGWGTLFTNNTLTVHMVHAPGSQVRLVLLLFFFNIYYWWFSKDRLRTAIGKLKRTRVVFCSLTVCT